MVEKVHDLYLPNAIVARLIKDALPDGINVGKEARVAIARAATVFGIVYLWRHSRNRRKVTRSCFPVLYLTEAALVEKRKRNHKTLSGEYVLEALKSLEFENFVDIVRDALNNLRTNNKKKKEIISTQNANKEKPLDEVAKE